MMKHKKMFSSCGFADLKFVRLGDEHYSIEVPKLTYRELRFLDRHLPNDDCNVLQRKARAIPETDLARYMEVYRWFPAFAEADL